MNTQSQRGSAIILALGFMTLILIIGAGVHGLVLGQLSGSGSLRERTTADYVAQGGVARAISWFTNTNYQMPQASQLSGAVPVLLGKGGPPVVLPSSHPDSYIDTFGTARVGVTKSFNTYLSGQRMPVGTYSVTASLIATQPETWELLAVAEYGTTAQRAGALLVRNQEALFRGALFGRDSLKMSGNSDTDSYDASLGSFGGSNVGSKGDVGSNSAINVSGSAQVSGAATPGVQEQVTLSGSAKVTGSTAAATSPRILPFPAVPAGAIDLGEISLKGKETKTLTPGTYILSSLSLSGQGTLKIDNTTGPVTLYLTGDLSMNGDGIENLSGLPDRLSIIQAENRSVSFGGNSTFYGTIYAPGSSLTFGGGTTLFGGFIGQDVSAGGTATIHYDENLRRTSTTPSALRVMSQWSAGSS